MLLRLPNRSTMLRSFVRCYDKPNRISSGVNMPGHLSENLCVLLLVCTFSSLGAHRTPAAQNKDAVAQAIADGDLYTSKKKYELALEAYRKADKLSHHSSPEALLNMARIEKKAGALSDAANDARKAITCAQSNKAVELRGRLMRATLLTEMAGKPTDNKLKDAEAELRAAVALAPNEGVAHFNLGIVLLKQERDADGIAELKHFLEIPEGDSAMVAEAKRTIANPIRARAPFAPDFSFHSHDNQSISNASLRGKVVLLDFWGTWCPPCRESVPILKNVQKKYNGKAFQLLSISSDDDEDVWKTFIESQRMDWTEYLDSSGALQEAFKIEAFPTYIVMDKDGVIRFRQAGLSLMTQGDLEEAINRALKRASDPNLAKAAVSENSETPEEAAAAPVKSEPASTAPSAPANAPPPDTSGPTFDPPEGGRISGNVYTNPALRLRFEFPAGWIAEKAEALHESNEQLISSAQASLMKQHPELTSAPAIRAPKAIFYASRRGDGNAQRATLSSMRIQAVQLPNGMATEDLFQRMTARMVSAAELIEVTPAAAFEVKQHSFIRAEFERKSGALHYYEAMAQTSAGDYLLTIEWYAASLDELRTIGDSLQKMEIRDQE